MKTFRALGTALLALWVVILDPTPGVAQWEAGLGIGVGDTRQNSVAVVSTLTWNFRFSGLKVASIRGFADSELAVADLKQGLGFESPAREWIVDVATGERQRPEGDTLWQSRGWDTHAALYLTLGWWRFHGGIGYAYNGLDGTSQRSTLIVVYVTRSTELDIELLGGGAPGDPRRRLRVSVGFWR